MAHAFPRLPTRSLAHPLWRHNLELSPNIPFVAVLTQVYLFLCLQKINSAHVLSPYPAGLYHLHASQLYVSRGLGTAWAPIRLNAPPEVGCLTLT